MDYIEINTGPALGRPDAQYHSLYIVALQGLDKYVLIAGVIEVVHVYTQVLLIKLSNLRGRSRQNKFNKEKLPG